MRYILAVLFVLFSCSVADAQSFPGLMPSDTILCNNTAVEALGENCNHFVLPTSIKFWTSQTPPAPINYIGSRLFMGDAVLNPGTALFPASCSTGDWFSNFEGASSNTNCAYFPWAQLIVLNQSNSGGSAIGILGGAQTSSCGNCAAIGIMGVGMMNSNIPAGAFALYLECEDTVAPANGGCSTIESEFGNFFANAGTPDPYAAPVNRNLALGCGNGMSSPTTYECESAIFIVGNTKTFNSGILFAGISGSTGGIESITPGAGPPVLGSNSTAAIQMPTTYYILWYTAQNTAPVAIWGGAAGNLNLAGNNLVINGTAAVSCPAGTVGFFTIVVTNGIVTHC